MRLCRLLLPDVISDSDIEIEKGCHSHNISAKTKESLERALLHPVIHTLSVAFFVFLVTFLINLLFAYFAENPLLFVNFAFLGNKVLQPVYTALFGIIPNCAVSVGLTNYILKAQSALLPAFQGFVPGLGLGFWY